ncbi:MAG: LuxR C-terminal-related transcriptional regulator [Gemmatimonadales bacterium]
MGTTAAGGIQRTAASNGRLPRQERISVGLIEHHRLLREQLPGFLNRQPGLHVVVSAAATPEGVERLQAARPQVVAIDVAAGPQASHDCLRRVRGLLPEARVVMINVPPMPDDIILFIEHGAGGLLHQDATVDEFVETITMVSGGTNMIPEPLIPVLFSGLANPTTPHQSTRRGDSDDPLTVREREVANLIAGGASNQAIANHLAITLHTVKTHVHNILAKFHLQSRLQIAAHVGKHRR